MESLIIYNKKEIREVYLTYLLLNASEIAKNLKALRSEKFTRALLAVISLLLLTSCSLSNDTEQIVSANATLPDTAKANTHEVISVSDSNYILGLILEGDDVNALRHLMRLYREGQIPSDSPLYQMYLSELEVGGQIWNEIISILADPNLNFETFDVEEVTTDDDIYGINYNREIAVLSLAIERTSLNLEGLFSAAEHALTANIEN